MPDEHRLKVYEQLCNSYRAIDEFRTKLLGFLPLATGTGVFLLLTDRAKIISMQNFFKPIGLFGFFVTLGLFFYELYGIKKCSSLITAGQALERVLAVKNGQFRKRPPGVFFLINEPFAAALIYPSVLAAWIFIAMASPQLKDSKSQADAPLEFSGNAQWWAISVFLIFFALAFFYNVFLVRSDIRRTRAGRKISAWTTSLQRKWRKAQVKSAN